jgi:hypothetical protein
MSDNEASGMKCTDELIDRVVDGALSPAELRDAVAELDSIAGGWRQCALAFLEAQSWGEIFRQVSDSVAKPRLAVTAEPGWGSPLSALTTRRRWTGFSRAAAIALVAFAVGWLGHGLSTSDSVASGRGRLAASESKNVGVESGPKPPAVPASMPGPFDPGALAQLPVDRLPTVREVARLRIGSSDESAAEVPILAGPGVSKRWLIDQPPPISEHLQAVWRQQGYQLQQTRQFVSVPLADGHRAAVPVDHVQLRYVGRKPL